MVPKSILAIMVLLSFTGAVASADTIRLKGGSTLRGKVTRFDGKEFTVILEGTHSRAIVSLTDVSSIDFEEAPGGVPVIETPPISKEEIAVSRPAKDAPPPPQPSAPSIASPSVPRTREASVEISANEVWSDTAVDVKSGQKVRISASGRVTLMPGRTSGAEGIDVKDPDKLLPEQPTGGLIGVIGDDDDDFFWVGAALEFMAKRDGRLFLMLNEGNLDDNSGSFTIRIQVDGSDAGGARP